VAELSETTKHFCAESFGADGSVKFQARTPLLNGHGWTAMGFEPLLLVCPRLRAIVPVSTPQNQPVTQYPANEWRHAAPQPYPSISCGRRPRTPSATKIGQLPRGRWPYGDRGVVLTRAGHADDTKHFRATKSTNGTNNTWSTQMADFRLSCLLPVVRQRRKFYGGKGRDFSLRHPRTHSGNPISLKCAESVD
jgi:hypothetical protein